MDDAMTCTMKQWIDQYPELASIQDSTLRMHMLVLRRIAAAVGSKKKLSSITGRDAHNWWLKLQGKDSTKAKYVRQAKAIFEIAKLRGEIETNPFSGLSGTAPKAGVPERDLTTGEVMALFACDDPHVKRYAGLCGLAGMRRSEAEAAQWDDINWPEHTISVRVRTKPGSKQRRRRTPLCRDLFRMLASDPRWDKTIIPPMPGRDGGLFYRKFWQKAEPAGVEHIGRVLQMMRRWRESTWAEDFPLPAVCLWMGNSPRVAMEHYMGTSKKLIERATG